MAQVKVTARISRNYGPVTVAFEISQDVEATTVGDIIKANDSSIKALNQQFAEYETEYLPKLPIPQNNMKMDGKPEAAKWYVATSLHKTMQNGKPYWTIKIGNEPKWAKFGAALYFDRMKGLTEDEAKGLLDPDTWSHKFIDGMRVLVEVYQGKPRAIQLAMKDTIGEG